MRFAQAHGVRTCSTVTPRSMASRIRCDPLSEPIHTRKQPSSASVAATRSFMRSARVMHSKGMRRPRRFISAAYVDSQP